MRRFLMDAHLGRLAKYLRILGLDAAFDTSLDDDELLRVSRADGRMLLSRDRILIERAGPSHGYLVRAVPPRAQLAEVLARFDLRTASRPLTLCLACNAPISRLPKSAVTGKVDDAILERFDDYWHCAECQRIFWRGSHYERMREFAHGFLMSQGS